MRSAYDVTIAFMSGLKSCSKSFNQGVKPNLNRIFQNLKEQTGTEPNNVSTCED